MKYYISVFLLCFFIIPIKAQTYSYEFLYDASGNRTQRTVIPIPAKALDTLSDTESLLQEEASANALREDFFDGRSIAIFPNPTTGELILEIIPLEPGTKGNISIYTTNGSLLLIQETLNELNRLDLSDLLPASYLLHVTLEGKTKTYKIIKQ